MPYEPLDPDFETKVRSSFGRQQFMEFIGAKLVEVRPGYCEIHVPYKEELSQQHGLFHGGVVGTIADNTAGYAAFSLMRANSSILTVEYKLNLVAPADGETLIGRGEVIKRGRTLTICRSEVCVVKDGVEKPCATSLSTFMELPGKSDAPPANGPEGGNAPFSPQVYSGSRE